MSSVAGSIGRSESPLVGREGLAAAVVNVTFDSRSGRHGSCRIVVKGVEDERLFDQDSAAEGTGERHGLDSRISLQVFLEMLLSSVAETQSCGRSCKKVSENLNYRARSAPNQGTGCGMV